MSEIWAAGPRPAFWPSFGSVLRGLRLGYRWSNQYQCFIRLSVVGDQLYLIEVAPDKGIPGKVIDTHRCWWEQPEVLDLCPALKTLGQVTAYQKIYLDENGERISRP